MTNLLKNGGFETDWGVQKLHRCWVNRDGDTWLEEQIGNIFTPADFWVWFKHREGKLAQPEVRDVWVGGDARRVHSGQKGTLLFTFGKKHDAGLFQEVDVTPGTTYRLTAWAHAWSNHLGGPHPHDPYWSEGAGREVVAWPSEPPLPYDTGDQQTDAKPNFTFSVGIDPLGGRDPFASSVVWGDGYHIYNGYCHRLEVECKATGPKMTVFIRSVTLWEFTHNDFYCDDMVLEVADETPEPPEPPEPPIPPTPGDCPGEPRLDYARTVNVIPPNATLDQAQDIFLEAWQRSRETVGGSYDDAGIGALSMRRANLYGIPVDDRPAYTDFYDKWYPGTEVAFKDIPGGEPSPSVLRLTYPTTFLPPVITQEFGGAHGGIDLRSSYRLWGSEAVCALAGKVVEADWSDTFGNYILTRTTLADGRVVDVRYAHLMADVYVRVGDNVTTGQRLGKCNGTADPSVADHLHFSVKADGVYVDPKPLIDWPDGEPEPPVPVPPPDDGEAPILQARYGVPSPHVQAWDGMGAMAYIAAIRPAVVKVFHPEDVRGVLAATDCQTHVVVRNASTYPSEDPAVGPTEWINRWKDSLNNTMAQLRQEFGSRLQPGTVLYEEPNEWIGGDLVVNRTRVDWSVAFCERLAVLCPGWAPATYCIAVGNPPAEQYALWVPMAQALVHYQGAAGYHAYHIANRLTNAAEAAVDWPWLAGRWIEMDKVWVAAGYRVSWYSGESGAIDGIYNPPAGGGQGTPGGTYWMNSGDPAGWRDLAYHGDWTKYGPDLLELTRRARAFGKRFWGWCVFTVGGPNLGWESFKMKDPEWAWLQAQLASTPIG